MNDRHLEPHRGTLVLVMGILGIVVCFICGILAWVWGGQDLKKMKAGTMDPEGMGLTQAGWIMGIISVILAVLGIVFAVLVLGGMVVMGDKLKDIESSGIIHLLGGF